MRVSYFCMCILSAFAFTYANSSNATPLSKMSIPELTNYVVEQMRPHSEGLRQWIPALIDSPDSPTYAHNPKQPRLDYIGCDTCRAGVGVVKQFWGLSPEIMPKLLTEIIIQACQILKLVADEYNICRPAIESFAPSVFKILEDKPELKVDDFCGILINGCGNVNTSLTDWTINVAPGTPTITTPPPLPENVGKSEILQFTDIHLDLDYVLGSNGLCSRPAGCCRDGEGDTDAKKAGKFGHFGCSLPEEALASMFDHAKSNHPNPKYIFLTGDYIHSAIWLYNKEENYRHLEKVTQMLANTFPDTPIFPLVGNHETPTVNMFSPKNLWSQFDLAWMYQIVGLPFMKYIPADQHTTFLDAGYYTVKPDPNVPFRLIVLNTNLCYLQNFWLVYDTVDPTGQLQWFADEMLKAETANEKVYILGHIQPGSGSCWSVWSEQFDRVIKRFGGIIQAQFYGHSHREYFSLSFDKDLKPLTVTYNAPSGVTDKGHTAYKLYEVDGERGAESTFEVIDHTTYFMNLTSSNQAEQPVWSVMYSAKSEFGLNSLRPDALYEFIVKMITDNALFRKFVRIHHKAKPSYETECTSQDCLGGMLCDLVSTNSNNGSACAMILDLIEKSTEDSSTEHTSIAIRHGFGLTGIVLGLTFALRNIIF